MTADRTLVERLEKAKKSIRLRQGVWTDDEADSARREVDEARAAIDAALAALAGQGPSLVPDSRITNGPDLRAALEKIIQTPIAPSERNMAVEALKDVAKAALAGAGQDQETQLRRRSDTESLPRRATDREPPPGVR